MNKFLINERTDHIKELTRSLDTTHNQEFELEYFKEENKLLQEQLNNTKSLLGSLGNSEMEVKDIVRAILMFLGEKKMLDGFFNTCEIYMTLVKEEQKPILLNVIKAKITGEALLKIQPLNALLTWGDIKKKLKDKILHRVSLEYAQEDMNNVFQKKDESTEDYGLRVKTKLRSLNDAIRSITNTEAELNILRQVNEKLAVSKFEQNLRDRTVKVLVFAAS